MNPILNATLANEIPPVSGLPAGIEFSRIGIPSPDDYEIVGGIIYKGKRDLAAASVIVTPAAGYKFVPLQKFDIREMVLIDGPPNSYMPVPETEDVTRQVQIIATFETRNAAGYEAVQAAAKMLEQVPGFKKSDVL